MVLLGLSIGILMIIVEVEMKENNIQKKKKTIHTKLQPRIICCGTFPSKSQSIKHENIAIFLLSSEIFGTNKQGPTHSQWLVSFPSMLVIGLILIIL